MNLYAYRKRLTFPHVICVRCQKMIDPNLGSLKGMKADVADEFGFDILAYRLDFFNICGDCKKEENRQTKEEGSMKRQKF